MLLGIVILVFGIAWAKGVYFGAKPETLTIRFANAGGAERGDPVYIRGIKRGLISDVDVNERGEVIMELQLDVKIPLRRDASASIMMLELMGGKKIEILPGVSQTAFNSSTDTIEGTSAGDLSTLVALVNSMSESLRSIVGKADTLFTSINDVIGDPKVRADIKGAIAEARIALKDVSVTLRDVRTLIAENRTSLRNTIAELEKLSTNMNAAVNDLAPAAKAAIADTRAFIAQASATLEKADIALTEIDKMLIDSRTNKSLLYRITSDKEFGERIDSTLINAQKLIKEIRMQGLNANIRFFQGADPLP